MSSSYSNQPRSGHLQQGLEELEDRESEVLLPNASSCCSVFSSHPRASVGGGIAKI